MLQEHEFLFKLYEKNFGKRKIINILKFDGNFVLCLFSENLAATLSVSGFDFTNFAYNLELLHFFMETDKLLH